MRTLFKNIISLQIIIIAIFNSDTVLAQTKFSIGDSVEVQNTGKGIIVSDYQQTEWGYGTYKVHMFGEKYCNNHAIDTRYNSQYIAPLKKAVVQDVKQEGEKTSAITKKEAGIFKTGEEVLYTQTSTWQRGIIKNYDPVTRLYTLQDVYVGIPCHSIVKPANTYNNDFFIGTWNVKVSGAIHYTEKDDKVQGNISGGTNLYPLVIKKDGTYTWKISSKKTIGGKWKNREDAPGIVILKGIDNLDWIVYETTEAFATSKETKDEIRFHHKESGSGYLLATRSGANKSCVLTGRTFK
jgi:uncharacterized protein YodC (DUF2158 family)